MVNVVTFGFAQIVAAGLNLSVTCAEDIPFITESDVATTSANSFEGDLRVRAQQQACRIWSVRPVPASFDEPVRSDAPILMISGSDDPTSPPQYAQRALPYLPNARILLIKNAGHGTETPCSDALIVAFVRAQSARGLDLTRCAGELSPSSVCDVDGGVRRLGRKGRAGAATNQWSMSNIPWESDYQTALERARADRKFVFLDVFNPG